MKKLDGKGAYGDEEIGTRTRVTIKLLVDVCTEDFGSDIDETKRYLQKTLTDIAVDDYHKTYMENTIIEEL